MSIYGVPFHPITFFIVLFELLLLVVQYVDYLQRLKEKQRLWQLILLILVILRNTVEGAFQAPNPDWPISLLLQNFLGQGFGYIVASYFPLYWYKTLGLNELKLHGRYGFLFLIVPVIFVYGLIYPVNQDIMEARKYVYVVPFFYGIAMIAHVIKATFSQYKKDKNKMALKERVLILMAIVPWMTAPFIGIGLKQPQWVIDISLNTGFFILNVLLIRQIVKRSREEQNEHDRLKTNLSDKEKGIAFLEQEKKQQQYEFKKVLSDKEKGIACLEKEKEEQRSIFTQVLSDKEKGIVRLKKEKEAQQRAFTKALNALKQNNTDPMLVFEFNCQLYKLSPAEIRVAKQVRLGFLNKEIANQFGRSIRTIETHMSNIYSKVGIEKDKQNDDSSVRAKLMKKLNTIPENINQLK